MQPLPLCLLSKKLKAASAQFSLPAITAYERLIHRIEKAMTLLFALNEFIDGGVNLDTSDLMERCLKARDDLAGQGLAVDYMRIRGFPFNETVERFLEQHDRVVVIEQNRDEQLRKLITIETQCPKEKLDSITYYGGQPLSKGHVLDGLAPWIPELAGGGSTPGLADAASDTAVVEVAP